LSASVIAELSVSNNLAFVALSFGSDCQGRALRFSFNQSDEEEKNMKKIANRILVIAFASVVLLLAAAPAQAQAPPTVTNTYAAKFICGVQSDANINSAPDAQPGRYATKINVHNNSGFDIRFRKKVIQLRGGQVPTEPAFKRIEVLQPDWAMEVVCRDIYGHLNIPLSTTQPPPHIEGFVIFEVFFPQPLPTNVPDDPLDIEGIYTYFGAPFGQGASIDVEVYPAKRNRYALQP
jgi:hypothetical protein